MLSTCTAPSPKDTHCTQSQGHSFACPLQNLEVPVLRRLRARILVPRSAVRASPLQHLEVPALRRILARPPAPRASVRVQPLKHLELPAQRRSRAPTASPRGFRPLPPQNTCSCPTVCRPLATPSTLRAVRSPPLPHKGVRDAADDLPVAGAAARLNIRVPRRHPHQATQTEAPSPPPRRASHGSPLGAVRDRRGRRNIQT